MKLLGNIIWIIFGGLISAIGWWLAGIFWCITIIGIPIGVQCFKFSKISLCPFGKDIVYEGGAGSLLLNIIWVIVSGIELAITNAILGCLCCITIIGIPFGLQFFKIAGLALLPFGSRIVKK